MRSGRGGSFLLGLKFMFLGLMFAGGGILGFVLMSDPGEFVSWAGPTLLTIVGFALMLFGYALWPK